MSPLLFAGAALALLPVAAATVLVRSCGDWAGLKLTFACMTHEWNYLAALCELVRELYATPEGLAQAIRPQEPLLALYVLRELERRGLARPFKDADEDELPYVQRRWYPTSTGRELARQPLRRLFALAWRKARAEARGLA